MKTKILNNYITKRALFALSLVALPFATSLNAADFDTNGEEVTFSDVVEESGNINIFAGKLTMNNSSLGSSSGGRFNMSIGDSSSWSTLHMNDTTAYFNTINFGGYMNSAKFINSNIFVDNAVEASATDFDQIEIHGGVFKAPSIVKPYSSGSTGSTSILITDGAYADFSVIDIASLTIENSTWRSFDNTVDTLYLKGNVVLDLYWADEYISNSMCLFADTVVIEDNASVTFKVGFGDLMVADIMEMEEYVNDGYVDFDFLQFFIFNTVVGNGTSDEFLVLVDSSDSYTWTVTDMGDGVFRMSDFALIPEPSTYAAIFGALALALAIYRRRK